MEHVSQPEAYYPFPKELHYQELIGDSFESARRTVYVHQGKKYPLPAFTFNHLSKNEKSPENQFRGFYLCKNVFDKTFNLY